MVDGTTRPAAPRCAELDALYESLSNWGRWGDDDESGTLNHLTPSHRVEAARLVRSGRVVSLAHDLSKVPSAENPFPADHHMLAAGDARDDAGIPGYEASRDYVGSHVHGLGVTHVDALCHMFVRGEMYNGRPASEVRSDGAERNTVLSLAEGVVGRGVLLDIPALLGIDYLEQGGAVGVAELRAAEERQGVAVGCGDIMLVSLGRDALRTANGGVLDPAQGIAGLREDCLAWLRDREVAVLGSDGISDPLPGVGILNWPFPIHQIGIVSMGLHLIDNMALGALSRLCAQREQWAFMFTMGVLRVPGGTGCPVNPLAVL
jgi:kynurenine formamidase